MRKALCVGIDYYEYFNGLNSCINDAKQMGQALSNDENGDPNFEVKYLCASNKSFNVTRRELKDRVSELFSGDPDIALFYFSGHGSIDSCGGYLCTSEITKPDEGLSLDELMKIVRDSSARNKVIILDSCHSGQIANHSAMSNFSELPENTVILAACQSDESAYEGVFTPLLLDALMGGAMNLLGEVTPGSVYSHLDRSLGAWDQRPIFKANIKNFVCLRKNIPPVSKAELRKLIVHFDTPDMEYQLDPTYEEDKRDIPGGEKNPEHEAIFKLFRKYASLNLLVPVGAPHMYQAAVNSKQCELTPLGRYYWNLVKRKKI